MKHEELVAELGRNIAERANESLPPIADLKHIVRAFNERRGEFLTFANQTPCYVLDVKELKTALSAYSTAFNAHIPKHRAYYALKVNHHPEIVKRIVSAGYGIDASSAREMNLALAAGATDILLTGPGKSETELLEALKFTSSVRINIDSFGELTRLGGLARKLGVVVRAGVRVTGRSTEHWSKFGIPLSELRTFWQNAKSYQGGISPKTPGVILEGIQFHSSWNLDASPYAQMMEEVGSYLKSAFSPEERAWIKFIDCGGGFRPYKSEGTYAWKLPLGAAQKALDPEFHLPGPPGTQVYETEASTLDDYARGIGAAVVSELSFLDDIDIYTEPGRVLCNNAMHILLKVVDKKASDVVILDGGINLIGWERFEHDYFPVINLTRPAGEREVPCRLYGPLCMPQDQWGFGYFGTGIEEGDVLLVPYQGALTFSLAQEFIRPIARVNLLDPDAQR